MLVNFFKTNRKKIFLIFLAIIFVSLLFYYDYHDHKDLDTILYFADNQPVSVNYRAGVYHKSLKIELTPNVEVPRNSEIYYTLNGDDPNNESIFYTQEIDLPLEDKISVYPLKYVIYYQGKKSEIYEQDYILTEKDFFQLPIISISTDKNNLYNATSGIFVKENIYEREDEWIRQAHILMTENESVLMNQGIGIQVSGRASAAYPQKSLKISAGEPYDKNHDKLLFNNLNNNQEISLLSNVTEYQSLRLRTGPHDIGNGNVRTALLSHLAMNSNYVGYANNQKAVLFLNGNFYAIVDIQENYSNSFLKKRFDLPDSGRIEKYKDGEESVLKEAEVYDLFFTDLNKESNRQKLEQAVDMDDFLTYYAIEILINNSDWIRKNYEMWRYTGKSREGNKYTDGRLRFLLYDADLTYYLKDYELWDGVSKYVFDECTKEGKYVLEQLLKSDYYKNKFLCIMQDLLNTSFKEEEIIKIVEREYNRIKVETNYYYDEKTKQANEKGIENIKKGISTQNKRVEKTIQELASTTKKYHMKIEVPENAMVSWNQMRIGPNATYEQDYYENTSLLLNAQASLGYKLEGYLINDKKVEGNQVLINKKLANKENQVIIKIIVAKEEETELIISEVSAKSDSDWMKFTNVSSHAISLQKYYISDEEDNKRKYQLPDVELEPNTSIIINGKKNYYAIGDYICNFNLNNKEHLYLYDSEKEETIETLDIPRMSENETYGRYSNSNQFVFYDNSSNQRKK